MTDPKEKMQKILTLLQRARFIYYLESTSFLECVSLVESIAKLEFEKDHLRKNL